MRYRWQFWPNDACSTLHLSVPVPSFGSVLDPPDGVGVGLKEALETIDGIEEVSSCHRYQIHVVRGLAFDWPGVQHDVIRVVCGFFDIEPSDAYRMDDIEARQETPSEAMDYDC